MRYILSFGCFSVRELVHNLDIYILIPDVIKSK